MKKNTLLLILLITAVFLVWIGAMFIIPSIYKAPDSAGTFGDMFGSINALFSGLAFVGIIITILIQSEELGLQREELKATREQLEKQNETLSKQAFENTFFQLLKTFNEIINSVEYTVSEKHHITGRLCLKWFYKEWEKSVLLPTRNKFTTPMPEIELNETINKAYLLFHNTYEMYIGPYFRMVYNILKLIDQTEKTDKQFYINILYAQLSDSELSLLYYHCVSDIGKEKLAPLVIKYNLLKHMPQNEITKKIKLS